MPEVIKEAEAAESVGRVPAGSTAAWEAAIAADLKGADYEKRLVWRTDEGLKVKPYYRSEDLRWPEGQAEWLRTYPFTRRAGAVADCPERTDRRRCRARRPAARCRRTAVQELAYALAEGIDSLAGSPAG